jgi:hypothetical protein
LAPGGPASSKGGLLHEAGMSEKPMEDTLEENEARGFEIREADDFIHCVFVIDILAKILLHWLRKFKDRRHLAATLEDLRLIRAHSKAFKHRLRRDTQEAFGDQAVSEAKSRYFTLWAIIKSALKRRQFFE